MMMKKIKFATPFNTTPDKGEVNSGRVITVPDMSYTIRELLERFTQGTMPPIGLTGDYDYIDSVDDDEVFDALIPDPIDPVEASYNLTRFRKENDLDSEISPNPSSIVNSSNDDVPQDKED